MSVSIQCDPRDATPLYLQIARQIEEAVRSGEIRDGERLPSVRALASRLGVNKVTVVSAYRELARSGMVVQRVGSGTFVSGREPDWMRSHRAEIDAPAGSIDLATAAAPAGLFPVDEFRAAIDEVIERDGADAFDYGQIQGYEPLRESVAEYLSGAGLRTDASGVHVVSGAQQGLDLLSKVLLSPGDTALVESPGYPGARACFAARGARVVELPVGEDGPDPGGLTRIMEAERPRLTYINPDFQNPTGVTYNIQTRQQLAELAGDVGGYIIEDDFSGELSYGRAPVPPVAVLDRSGRVIYLKSVSALSLSGLRLAFLVVPPRLAEAVTRAKYLADITSGGLLQRAFDRFLRSGGWAQHVAVLKGALGSRYRLAVDRLESLVPGVRFRPPGGGLNLWLRLPRGIGASDLERQARQRGLLLLAGGVFGAGDSNLRISFGSADEDELAAGIYVLSRLIPREGGRGTGGTRKPVV